MRNSRVYITLTLTILFLLLSTKLIASQNTTSDERHSIGNLLNATADISGGVLNNFGNALPTPEEIFDAPIQLIFGLPFELLFKAINELCSFSFKAGSIKPKYKPTNKNLEIQLHTPCKIFYYKLTDTDKIINNTKFDPNKKVIVLVSGWNTDPNNTGIVKQMAKAFFCRGSENVFVLDAGAVIDTLYTWAAYNVQGTGKYLAKFLSHLIKFVPLENIHLIGHSLGAQIVSFAAVNFRLQTHKELIHITGLDPAAPCFNEGEELSGLSSGDAKFVDVIHTNPGVLGKPEAVGDVDFYTNGFEPLVPGCLDISCSHQRAWELYVEKIYPGNERDFLATRCNSLYKLQHGRCTGKKEPMGYAVDKNLTGDYFLEINPTPPFGKEGSKKRNEANKNCGLCNN